MPFDTAAGHDDSARMETVVERLARSPKLGLIYRDLTELWEQEQNARQRFYESVEDGQKAEFINGDIIVHSPDKLKHVDARKRLTSLLHNFVATHELGLSMTASTSKP